MTTERTRRDQARRDLLLAEAQQLEAAIAAAVRQDFPNLYDWQLQLCTHRWTPDGWRAFRSAGEQARYLQRYLDRAVYVASARISEAYGLGAGLVWIMRHNLHSDYDSDLRAAAQIWQSARSVTR